MGDNGISGRESKKGFIKFTKLYKKIWFINVHTFYNEVYWKIFDLIGVGMYIHLFGRQILQGKPLYNM